jgi:hypothetical protein
MNGAGNAPVTLLNATVQSQQKGDQVLQGQANWSLLLASGHSGI